MTIILFILYSVLMAVFQVALKDDWRVKDYQIFHAFGLVLNLSVICGLIWLPKPENVPVFALTAITIYWIVFDISYNLFSGNNIFHVGGGGMDRVLGIIQYPVKLILLILITWLNIKI